MRYRRRCSGGDVDRMAEVQKMDDRVDNLYSAIASYLARLGTANLSKNSAGDAMSAMTVTTELENVGDIIETNMSHLTSIFSRPICNWGRRY